MANKFIQIDEDAATVTILTKGNDSHILKAHSDSGLAISMDAVVEYPVEDKKGLKTLGRVTLTFFTEDVEIVNRRPDSRIEEIPSEEL